MSNHNKSPSLISNTNKIVTDFLILSFLVEADEYLNATRKSNHHVVFAKGYIYCVYDTTLNSTSESIIEQFCSGFTDKNNILVDVRFDSKNPHPTLELTTQDGKKYYIQDFSGCYFKL